MPLPPAKEALTEIEEVLTRRLGLEAPEFRLEPAELSGPRVSGIVISRSFYGVRDLDRQNRMWDALDAEYGPESVRRVGTLLAFTPDEWHLDDE